MGGVFDLKSEFAKYGEYHANKLNVAIHMIFVPTILWTVLGMSNSLGAQDLYSYPEPISSLLELLPGPNPLPNFATLSMAGYIVFYTILEPFAGLLFAPGIYTLLVTAQQFVLTSPQGMKVCLGLFVFGWVAQFAGHGFFERRAPALMDNIVQALVMAPFFVFLEVLFALGYRPSLHRELRSEIGVRILAFRRKQKQNAVGSAKASE
ncbi:hypothetical protein J3B02_001700 [Coemansia erecta]|uniref:DUF962 domain-containing protein n=1 Tax=Coemansia asiatica TaxID=1052880 RepID=A0A9W8CM62_9FUNG|nr:hypothetical protein LPJ64_001281 [Coemansia asiatica]KAJ2856261.1 hypothetical protein J3B02_001700 [Coemansia erecta]